MQGVPTGAVPGVNGNDSAGNTLISDAPDIKVSLIYGKISELNLNA